MSTSHGSKADFQMGTNALPTTLVTRSQFVNTASFPFNRDAAETTTFKKTQKTYIPGLLDVTISLEGPYDEVFDTVMADLMFNGTIFDFKYCPAGLAVVGTPAYTGSMFLTAYELISDVGDANAWSGEAQIATAVVRTVQ